MSIQDDYLQLMNAQGFDFKAMGADSFGRLNKLDRILQAEGINYRSYLSIMIPTLSTWLKSKGKTGYVPPAMLLKPNTIRWYQGLIEQSVQIGDSIQQRFSPMSQEDLMVSYYAHCENLYARRYLAMRIREKLSKQESHEIGMAFNTLDMPPVYLEWGKDRNTCPLELLQRAVDEIVTQLEKEYHKSFNVDIYADYPYESIVEAIKK